jgi:hypothetical protein
METTEMSAGTLSIWWKASGKVWLRLDKTQDSQQTCPCALLWRYPPPSGNAKEGRQNHQATKPVALQNWSCLFGPVVNEGNRRHAKTLVESRNHIDMHSPAHTLPKGRHS